MRGMDRLQEIIGKAPSELSSEEFLPRLKEERNRVRREMDNYLFTMAPSKAGKGRKPSQAKKAKQYDELRARLERLGLDPEEVLG